jgi:NTP pyrophosphatase (non-canonical NTP hydrolase)
VCRKHLEKTISVVDTAASRRIAIFMDLRSLEQKLRKFAAERDWEQFHSPKNLSMALSVEAAELLEHFQWLTEAQSVSLASAELDEVASEIADIQIYLSIIASKLGIDIEAAVNAKLESNAAKYPATRPTGPNQRDPVDK